MTRHTVNTINSDALDALYEQLEAAEESESQRQLTVAREALASATTRAAQAEAELAALRQVARGYCPACGRGDAAPTVEDWEQQRKRADASEAALARIAALADEHPAGIDTALIEEALDTTPAATEAIDRPDLAEQLRTAIESEIYEYRERTMWWEETGGVTEEIARLATRGAMSVRDEELARLRRALDEVLAAFNGMRNSDGLGDVERWQARVTPREYETWQEAARTAGPGSAGPT